MGIDKADRKVDGASPAGRTEITDTEYGTTASPPDPPTDAGYRPATSPPDPPAGSGTPPDDLVTRLFCATSYLRESFADLVARDLVRPSQLAMSPLWQVDALRVARHAHRARRQRHERDQRLFLAFGCLMIAGTLVLADLVTGGIGLGRALELWAVLWLWVYAIGVVVVFGQYRWARRSAQAVAFAPDPEADLEPEELRPPSVEQALVDLNAMNAVLFAAESSPFVGSGIQLDRWIMTLDVGPGVAGQPTKFTGADLQEALRRTVPDGISPRPSSGNRLYVRGGSSAPIVELFRVGPTSHDLAESIRFRRPVARVPEAVIDRYLRAPTEEARVYTVFQHSGWGGQVVLTLFVRALVTNQTLFIEVTVCALRPLRQLFYRVRGLSVRPSVEALSVGGSALADTLPLMFASPGRLWRRSRRRHAQVLLAREVEREIQGKRNIDFGAPRSLREEAASEDLADHFASTDEQMYYQLFNRRVLDCTGDFLASKGVDPAEFRFQRNLILLRVAATARSSNPAATSPGASIPTQGGSETTSGSGSGWSGGSGASGWGFGGSSASYGGTGYGSSGYGGSDAGGGSE